MSPFAFVESVREFWDGLLVLSGGISTGRALRAGIVLGADLVSMGTRFIVADESLAPEGYKQMVVDAQFDDIVCTNAFTGAWANMLRPSIVRAGFDPDNLGPARKIEVGHDPTVQAWKDIWSAGHGVGTVRRRQRVAQIVEEIEGEYRDAGVRAVASTCDARDSEAKARR
jgi:nitronate monooxygenase